MPWIGYTRGVAYDETTGTLAAVSTPSRNVAEPLAPAESVTVTAMV